MSKVKFMRVSLGWSTTDADVGHFLETWNVLAGSLLEGRSGIAAWAAQARLKPSAMGTSAPK
jgi:hypothetical protein